MRIFYDESIDAIYISFKEIEKGEVKKRRW